MHRISSSYMQILHLKRIQNNKLAKPARCILVLFYEQNDKNYKHTHVSYKKKRNI